MKIFDYNRVKDPEFLRRMLYRRIQIMWLMLLMMNLRPE